MLRCGTRNVILFISKSGAFFNLCSIMWMCALTYVFIDFLDQSVCNNCPCDQRTKRLTDEGINTPCWIKYFILRIKIYIFDRNNKSLNASLYSIKIFQYCVNMGWLISSIHISAGKIQSSLVYAWEVFIILFGIVHKCRTRRSILFVFKSNGGLRFCHTTGDSERILSSIWTIFNLNLRAGTWNSFYQIWWCFLDKSTRKYIYIYKQRKTCQSSEKAFTCSHFL